MTKFQKHETWFDKGVALQEAEKYAEALDCFQKAIDIKPDFIPAWVYKGISLEQLQRYEEAIKSYNQAIQINPNVADLWYNKGATFCKLKRYNDALACFDKVLDIEPDNALAQTTRTLILATPPVFKPTPKRPDQPEIKADSMSEEAEISASLDIPRQAYTSPSQIENEFME
ncbi:MAG: tetratricopeptide repeat protein [Xenococcaceae cyanobacterium]